MSFKKPFAIALITIISLSHAGLAGASVVNAKSTRGIAVSETGSTSNVTISGRVKTPNDRPIKGATIQLKDAATNEVVASAISSNFGYYKLENVETGRSYVVSVSHKRYLFALPAHLLEFAEDRANMDFVGEASE